MKYRESGMPGEQYWDSFFNPEQVLKAMEVGAHVDTFVDIGTGYGTFLFPASGIISGTAVGVDIDGEMIDGCREKVSRFGIKNIDLYKIDISKTIDMNRLDIYHGKINYIALFNILHCEEPLKLLGSAYDLLNPGGRLGVIHWEYKETPRGPSMDIRPDPVKITGWALKCKFQLRKEVKLPPYHYGLVFVK